MNRFAIIFAALLLPLFNLAQALKIDGNITGLKDGTDVKLLNLLSQEEVATTKTKAGKFLLQTKLPEPSAFGLMAGDSLKTLLFLDNDNVTINGSVNQKADEWRVTGSDTYNDFKTYRQTFVPIYESLSGINEKLQANETDALKQQLKDSMQSFQNTLDAFVKARPSSIIAVLALLETAAITGDAAVLEKRISYLTPSVLQTGLGQKLQETLTNAKFNAIGSVAQDFSQTDSTGKKIALSDLRGKYVLIDFWASWCGPCRMENKNLVKTFKKFQPKNFTVLGVSLDEDRDKWLAAIKKDGLAWRHVSDLKGWENEVAALYKIKAIPRNILIDPKGIIIAKDLRGADLDAKLEEILGK